MTLVKLAILRWRLWRAELLCRRNRRTCEACSHWFVQDLFAEDVRREGDQ